MARRNILVIGKTGAGKSTVANKIIGQNVFTTSGSVESRTSVNSHCDVMVVDERNGNLYAIRMIDTIGFEDTGNEDRDKTSNEEIIESVKRYFQTYTPEGLHLIIFVYRKGRFTQEEKKVFDFIAEKFEADIKPLSALVITCCDNETDEAREEIISNFREKPLTRRIANLMGKGIYAVGFPDLENTIPHFRSTYRELSDKYVTTLRQLIYSCEIIHLREEIASEIFWRKLLELYQIALVSSWFCGIL